MAGRLNAARLAPLVIWLGTCASAAHAQDVAPALVGRWDAVARSAGGIGQIIEFRADGSMTHWYAAMVEFTYVAQGSLRIASFTHACAHLHETAGQQEHDGDEDPAEDEQVEVHPADGEVLLQRDVDHRAEDRAVHRSHASDEGHEERVEGPGRAESVRGVVADVIE